MDSATAPPPLLQHLRAAGLRTRRALLRHRRLLVALCLAGAVVSGLRALTPPAPATVAVTVAARDLPAGHTLSRSDLTRLQAPPELAPYGALSPSAGAGRTLAGPLRRGTPLTDADLVAAPLLSGHPGKVALPVRLTDAGVAALLRPGDRIDLIATRPTDGSVHQVADAVSVITVPAPRSGAGGTETGALVVLAVGDAQAREIAGAAASMFLTASISR
ncbi:SAF domain-containing protein [Nocardioides dubius]|uniref:SAF domain-containing protein n=1 Tax=Nocardioides dubius TaxID=317019 RepID=A0ABP4EE63_9ACTN